MSPDVLILGGGIAGLTTAASLLRAGCEPLVLESATRLGGSITTHQENDFLAEEGPNSLMLENDGTEHFLRQLGLVPQEADPAAKKRFLLCHGKVIAAPANPFAALTTPLLSLPGKLRILLEPFAANPSTSAEESVAAFARRRLGDEVVPRLIDPMIAGVFAGDPEALSLRHALPRLHEMEQTYGSLLRAGLAKRRAAPRRRIVNFPRGMREMPDAMARFLGPQRISLQTKILRLECATDGWAVSWSQEEKIRRARARALVIAIPPRHWQSLPLPTGLLRHLRPWHALPAPPVSVLSLGFRRDQIRHPLDGFGMLIPACERRHILGTLFPSSLFPNRAPKGHVLLTSFLGGCRQPEIAALNPEDQQALVHEELSDLLGISGEPCFVRSRAWPRAIPQYNLGYGRLATLLDEAERDCSHLYFCGNFRGGISVPKTIRNALSCAEKILAALR